MFSWPSKSKHSLSFHDCSISITNVNGSLFVWSQGFPRDHCLKGDDTGAWEEERLRERQNERKVLKRFIYSEHNMSKNGVGEKPNVFSEPYLRKCQVRRQLSKAGMSEQRKVIPEQDKLLPFLFWSIIVLRSKFMAVCQCVPVGTGSSVPNWCVRWALVIHKLYTAENKYTILYTCWWSQIFRPTLSE